VGVVTGRMVLLRSLPHALAAMRCVSRRCGCCGGSRCVIAMRVRPRYHNVSVGDGVLDVPTLGSPPNFASNNVSVRCGCGRVPVSLDALCASWTGECGGGYWISGGCFVGDAALSGPGVYWTGFGVFIHKCCGFSIQRVYCSVAVVLERQRRGLGGGTLRAASPTVDYRAPPRRDTHLPPTQCAAAIVTAQSFRLAPPPQSAPTNRLT
jgi:hypothetical protein